MRLEFAYFYLMGPWSELKKFKTLDIDSVILKSSQRGNEFIEKQ